MSKRIPNVVWIVLIGWTAYALIFASQVAGMTDRHGIAVTWRDALVLSFGGWMTWIPLSLGLYALVKRHAIERGRVLRAMLALTGGALAVVVLRAGYVSATNDVFAWYGTEPLPPFTRVLATSFLNNFMLAWLVIGIAHAIVFHRRSRDHGRRVAELESSLATSRLDALRAQLNPHFLFNAINSVAEMVHRDAELADRMLVSLAALLRDGLSTGQDQMRLLRDEIALVRHYLMIEAIRLGDRLKVEWDIADEVLDMPVPALVLQPLVENAIVHGIARRRSPGRLGIRARRVGDELVLEVDNSVAAGAPSASGTGIGLHSTTSRLELLYGDRARLERTTLDDGRHCVRIALPHDSSMGASCRSTDTVTA